MGIAAIVADQKHCVRQFYVDELKGRWSADEESFPQTYDGWVIGSNTEAHPFTHATHD